MIPNKQVCFLDSISGSSDKNIHTAPNGVELNPNVEFASPSCC